MKKNKIEKVSIWGQLNSAGDFLVTVSSITGWLFSKNPKIANDFVKITNGLYLKLKKMRKEQEKKLKEKIKPLKEMCEELEPKEEKKSRFKFW